MCWTEDVTNGNVLKWRAFDLSRGITSQWTLVSEGPGREAITLTGSISKAYMAGTPIIFV